jgi:hypothetical protein
MNIECSQPDLISNSGERSWVVVTVTITLFYYYYYITVVVVVVELRGLKATFCLCSAGVYATHWVNTMCR